VSVRRLDAGELELGGGLEVLVAAALEGVAPGGEIDVVLASRSSALELPAWARISGHAVTDERSQRETGAPRWIVRVRRGAVDRIAGGELPPSGPPIAGPDRRVHMSDVRAAVGPAPARGDPQHGLAPLGATIEPGGPPHDWHLNERDALWAAEISSLTERAAVDGWDATTDIPWEAAAGLRPDVERAVAQVMTYIAQNEYAALYVPAASCRTSTRSTPRC
jgi:hypothetical protein